MATWLDWYIQGAGERMGIEDDIEATRQMAVAILGHGDKSDKGLCERSAPLADSR